MVSADQPRLDSSAKLHRPDGGAASAAARDSTTTISSQTVAAPTSPAPVVL
jgi:hypothetical protein